MLTVLHFVTSLFSCHSGFKARLSIKLSHGRSFFRWSEVAGIAFRQTEQGLAWRRRRKATQSGLRRIPSKPKQHHVIGQMRLCLMRKVSRSESELQTTSWTWFHLGLILFNSLLVSNSCVMEHGCKSVYHKAGVRVEKNQMEKNCSTLSAPYLNIHASTLLWKLYKERMAKFPFSLTLSIKHPYSSNYKPHLSRVQYRIHHYTVQ